jgi:hypothetical protein
MNHCCGIQPQLILLTAFGDAFSYRLDLDVYGTKCGYFSNVENCRPSTACVVDMYIDDKANLPWNNKARYASMYGRKSNALSYSKIK